MGPNKTAFEDKSHEVFENALHAAALLEKNGIVDSAAYVWKMCSVVKGADQMIINMAKYIREHN